MSHKHHEQHIAPIFVWEVTKTHLNSLVGSVQVDVFLHRALRMCPDMFRERQHAETFHVVVSPPLTELRLQTRAPPEARAQ